MAKQYIFCPVDFEDIQASQILVCIEQYIIVLIIISGLLVGFNTN